MNDLSTINRRPLHCCAVSDLHGYLPKETPNCDVMFCCGDIVPLEYQSDTIKSVSWFLLEFVPWVDSLPCKKFVFIGGNHDFFLEALACSDNMQIVTRSANDVMKRLLVGNHKGRHNKLVYLMDNSYEYEGYKFYGTPWIEDLSRWAFYKNEEEIKCIYNNIPKQCDVLLTHMPPITNDCGMVRQHGCFNTFAQYGSQALAEAIVDRNIRWSLCGHVHSGNHVPELIGGTNYVNVSIKDEDYKVGYPIFEFDLN